MDNALGLTVFVSVCSFPCMLTATTLLRGAGVRWSPPTSDIPKSAPTKSGNTPTVFIIFLVVGYFVLNSALSLLNRYFLGHYGFRFPIMMTAAHMIFGAVALTPMMMMSDEQAALHVPVLASQWKGLLVVALLNGTQIALNNASLVHTALSMNQVVRATVPVLTAIAGVCIEKRVPSGLEMLCLCAVSLGVVLCVYEESRSNELYGVALVGASAAVQSAQMSLSSKIMSRRLTSFQMTFYTGPAAFAMLLPMGLRTESQVLGAALEEKPLEVIAFLLGGCMLAVAYNILFFQCLQTISAIGTSVMANVKIVVLIFLSAFLFGELSSWPASQYAGCLCTFGGTWAYSALRQGWRPRWMRPPQTAESKE